MKKHIFLCDMTHTAHGVVSEFVPFAIGCIKEYFLSHIKNPDNYSIHLAKYPEELDALYQEYTPDIVGFSNYIWNSNLACAYAKTIKEEHPGTLIIFGGPNFPLDDRGKEQWLLERPYIDIYTAGEGEEPFAHIVEAYADSGDINTLKKNPVVGGHSVMDGALICHEQTIARMENLDLNPSPYLSGELDSYMTEHECIPMIETSRGCPFTCAYCEKGSRTWQKVIFKSPAIFNKEIEYIAQKTKSKILLVTDSNFGMYKQDIETCHFIADIREKYDFPYHVNASTGKNAEESILECAQTLKGSLPLTASVQSLDPEVLENVRRKNVSNKVLISLAKAAKSMDSATRSEVILALPGDTRAKHVDTICQLLDAEMDFILPYTLMLLDGSELTTPEYRNKFEMRTKYRLSHRCHGHYPFGSGEVAAAEVEEVVVGLSDFTFEDYLECRAFTLTSSLFYSDRLLSELRNYMNQFGISHSNFVKYVHDNRDELFSDELKELYTSYLNDTENELWDSREDLIQTAITTPDSKDIVAHNILFKHRAMGYLNHIECLTAAGFTAARQLLEKTNVSDVFLKELEEFSKFRTVNLLNSKAIFSLNVTHDFDALIQSDFKAKANEANAEQRLEFYHNEEQDGILHSFENSVDGFMRLLPRVSVPKVYRSVRVSK